MGGVCINKEGEGKRAWKEIFNKELQLLFRRQTDPSVRFCLKVNLTSLSRYS